MISRIFILLSLLNILLFPLSLPPQIECDKKIDKKIFKICYGFKEKGARAIVYEVNGSLAIKSIEKRGRFYQEKNIPKKFRVSPKDYIYTGYDRGHLAPDADFDYSFKTMIKTYTMANILPQTPSLNRKVWLKSEKYERFVAKKLGKVKVTIVAIFGNKNNFLRKKPIDKIKNSYRWSKRKIKKYFYFSKKLKEKKILIPTLFFKIIENREKNFKRCFIYPNIKYNIKKDKLRDHLIDCSIIENEIRAHYLKSSYELSKN